MNDSQGRIRSSGTASTSRSLLARCRSGDAAAWDQLVELYAPLVLHWCRSQRVPDSEIADVFQDVFRAAAANLERFRKERAGDTFRGWLRTITRNKVYDHFNRHRRSPRGAGGTDAQIQFAQIPAPQPLDDDSVENGIHAGMLRRALDRVRPAFEERTWRAFWGVVIDDRDTSDVAEELAMSTGAVRVAKSRVLHRLRAEIGELAE